MRTAGIEGPQACLRGLRHSFGDAAVVAGVPLSAVAAVLGHASLTTTAIGAEGRELVGRVWTQVSDPDPDARDSRVHPRAAPSRARITHAHASPPVRKRST